MANNGTPERGDMVEAFLKEERDGWPEKSTIWNVLDGLLDDYRLHADTGTPLDQEAYPDVTTNNCCGYDYCEYC